VPRSTSPFRRSDFARELLKFRRRWSLTQAQAAHVAGTVPTQWARWERAERYPDRLWEARLYRLMDARELGTVPPAVRAPRTSSPND